MIFATSMTNNAQRTLHHMYRSILTRSYSLLPKLARWLGCARAFLTVFLNSFLWSRSQVSTRRMAPFYGSIEIWWPTGPTAVVRRFRTLAWFVKPRPPPASCPAQPQHLLVERQVQGVGTSSLTITNKPG